MEENCDKTVTCKDVYLLCKSLEDHNFEFRLHLLYKIFPHIDIILFNQFQARQKDSVKFLKDFEEFGKISCLLEILWMN